MADVQTTGGYPVVAGVVRADLPAAAQLLPGDRVTFRQSDVDSGARRWSTLMAGLESLQ
jgi:allophanate hydrolase subunit 2